LPSTARAAWSLWSSKKGAPVPDRVGFVLHVKTGKIDDYIAAHSAVWPEMLTALKAAGISNYSIFRAGTQVFGYFETDDRAATEAYLADQPVCAEWQDKMAEFLEQRVSDGGPAGLTEIFRLD
jgi:L-rhamnose mutarotase